MKVIVFGVGNYYKEQKEKLNSFNEFEIMVFADNNSSLWNKTMDGIAIIPPDLIKTFNFDKILIMSIYVCAIYEQLLALGVDQDRILVWERFLAQSLYAEKGIIQRTLEINYLEGSILIISADLDYNGGTLAAVYAAMSLKQKNISVVLAAPKGNKRLIEEMKDNRIDVIEWNSLPYVFDTDRKWIQQFKVVIVNTFQMMECAYEVSKLRPTMWWIHEPLKMYEPAMMKYPDCRNEERWERLNIYAVSRTAQSNFNKSVGVSKCRKILTVGIPDTVSITNRQKQKNRKMIFAIVGTIHILKAQDIFVKAAAMEDDDQKSEFWIIGRPLDQEYFQKVSEMAARVHSIRILGELTRAEIDKAFTEIDVLVCASQEETLSITVIEAMMHGKACITTNTTGIAEYIKNGVNGFVISANDVNALAEKMHWLIEHKEEIGRIGLAARKTYEKYFTMDIFGKNLLNALNETTAEWRRINQENEKTVNLPNL